MQGERFVQLLEQQSLDALLSKVAAAHPAVTLSILLEGLHSYLRQVLQHFQDHLGLSLAHCECTSRVEAEIPLIQHKGVDQLEGWDCRGHCRSWVLRCRPAVALMISHVEGAEGVVRHAGGGRMQSTGRWDLAGEASMQPAWIM